MVFFIEANTFIRKMIKVETVKCLKDNFSYVIHNNTEALVIDPSESGPINRLLEKLKLKLKYISMDYLSIYGRKF